MSSENKCVWCDKLYTHYHNKTSVVFGANKLWMSYWYSTIEIRITPFLNSTMVFIRPSKGKDEIISLKCILDISNFFDDKFEPNIDKVKELSCLI